jgi:hypothetical protein
MVEMNGALKDWYLAIGCHQQTKKQTQDNGGTQQKLATTQGQLTCHDIPAPRKEHGLQGPGGESVVRRACKERTPKKR